MRRKNPLTLGILGLTLAGSVFVGCQDFMGGDNGKSSAPPSDAVTEQTVQSTPVQGSDPAATAVAEATPVATVNPNPEPVLTDPTDPALSSSPTGITSEQQVCLDLYNELQSAKEPAYGEAKNQYGEKNCDAVLGDKKPVVYVPPTLEERCRMFRIQLGQTQPTDAKWAQYVAEMNVTCADYP